MKAEYINYCVEAAKKYGTLPSVVIGICMEESSGFERMPANSNNGFGITSRNTSSGFREYATKKESAMDFAKLVTNGIYKKYTSSASTPEEWVRAIVKAGYNSVNKNYTSDVLSIIKKNNLTQYDKDAKRTTARTVAVSSKQENSESAKDIVDVAMAEVGYHEEGSNLTKYGSWYGSNGAAWCHMFVSWCANRAGVSTSIVPKTASTTEGMNWFKKRGIFKLKGSYTPKRGDIIYFKSAGASHVGIVRYVKDGKVYTVEGNTSDKVGTREYDLNAARITGYGTPKYENVSSSYFTDRNEKDSSQSSSSASSEDEKRQKAIQEMAYLKMVLSRHETSKPISGKIVETKNISQKSTYIIGLHKKKYVTMHPVGVVKLTEERKGSAGNLEFEAYYGTGNYVLSEGNPVVFVYGKTKRFYGFVFTKSRPANGKISYTCYDQLRYLMNKDTAVYYHVTASKMLKRIAKKFNLSIDKKMADTKYKMNVIADNESLFDTLDDALDNTALMENQEYIMYDNGGKITIKNIKDMKVNSCVVDSETGEDYSYKSSIDSDTYNQIKLYYEDDKTGTIQTFMAKDSKSINKYGVLQYVDKIDYPLVGPAKANALLQLYDQKMRSLEVKGVIGNIKVRGGSLVPVMLNLGDIKVSNYMIVDRVVHSFSAEKYTMDMTMSGGGFSSE